MQDLMLDIVENSGDALLDRFRKTRGTTLTLIADLQAEDTVVQSMPDVSPTKWHLAHVTWFFERFVLEPCGADRFRDDYHYLFNSYYKSVGEMHPRPLRGELSRPTLAEVLDYRSRIDDQMIELTSAIREEREPSPGAEHGLAILRICDAAYRSAREDRLVNL